MYKVFHNRHTIIFNSYDTPGTDQVSDRTLITEIDITDIRKKIHETLKNQTEGSIVIRHTKPEEIQRALMDVYYPVSAAGGVVKHVNTSNTLMINRNGVWDLPKGKCEPGESLSSCAIRETTEETGITDLQIMSKAFITKHIYQIKGVWQLKTTHWFLMQTTDQKQPIPQLNEGITEAKWTGSEELQHAILTNTFPLIKEVLNHFNIT
jgi:8-oxo-dGTP pyrophosphatase MutT (NUDIX family)